MGMMMHRRRLMMASAQKTEAVEETVEAREEKPEECVAQKKSSLTAEDIEKLPFFSLKALALQHGIDVKDKKAKQLKKELLEKLKEE